MDVTEPVTADVVTGDAGPVGTVRQGVLRPLGHRDVRLEPDGLLGQWQVRNHDATIGHLVANLETSGVLANFRRVAAGITGGHQGYPFADSDLYKTLEAVAWESGRVGHLIEPEFVAAAIDLIARAQRPDGYLSTYVQSDPSRERWRDLATSHELYCAGHLFQAAVAMRRGTGQTRLLEVARRLADCIVTELADRPDGIDGHPEVETALVELYRETGDRRYRDFARTQVERRGHRLLPVDSLGPEYFQDHAPIEQVDEAVGHAVRQLYLATGATDVFLETGERSLLDAAERIWASAYRTKTYITGGQGSRHLGEAFGDPYELPPDRAYAETCAGVASFHWNWRMLLATGDGRYAHEMETVLYNTIAASTSLDGRHFFYTNPLQLRTGHRGATEDAPSQRLSWYACACCPPNLGRLMASLHDYLATRTDTGVQIHHLAPAQVSTDVAGTPVRLVVSTDVPWGGAVTLDVTGSGRFELAIRVPPWASGHTVTVDGEPAPSAGPDGYVRLVRDWDGTHRATLDLQVDVQVAVAHPRVDAVRGCVALRRGPFVYCTESVTHPGVDFEDIRIDPGSFHVAAGVRGVPVALVGVGTVDATGDRELYRAAAQDPSDRTEIAVTAIPYFLWGNKGSTAMRVWLPTVADHRPVAGGNALGDFA
jgi:DUF1680 family protein